MIERLETTYYRLPLNDVGDAGHGAIDSEELITLKLYAGGLIGHGYAYTIGKGGRAVQSLRPTERLTAEAVRDHHVVADSDTEHTHPSPYVIV